MQRQHFPHAIWSTVTLPLSATLAVVAFLATSGCHEAGEQSKSKQSAKGDSIGVQRSPAEAIMPARVPPTDQANRRQHVLNRVLDARHAGWETEAFNEAASAQLQRLAEALEQPDRLTAAAIAPLMAAGFRSQPLRPPSTKEVFHDATLAVRRMPATAQDDPQSFLDAEESPQITTAKGLVAGLLALPLPTDAGTAYHVKFKIIHVGGAGDRIETRILAEGGGPTSDDRASSRRDPRPSTAESHHRTEKRPADYAQWTAIWKCAWTAETGSMPPKLISIDVSAYEEVIAVNDGHPWLVDRTADVLGADVAYREQLAYGVDYWLQRIEGRLRINRLGHNGLAIGDVNGDGREDVYVCQTGGLPNRLYVAQSDGTAADISHEAGVDFLDDTTCALFVDLDNDADQDLIVITIAGGLVLSGDGTGRFIPRVMLPDCRNAFSLTAADYDGDRLLDIYVGRYWPSEETRGEIPIPVPYYDAQNGGRNVLLRNLGDWEFVEVTADVGLDADNTRYTMAAAWEDVDADGDADLYVANDFGRNCLYRNDGGRFTNVAAAAGVEDIASGMSVSFADYDRDGHADIYVSNMFSSAGNRITYQRQYEHQFAAADISSIQRMTRGNSLFRGQPAGTFTDVSAASGAGMGRWAWGSLFADLNNDAWDDLVVLNGFITADDTGDL